jgi:plastocyanin
MTFAVAACSAAAAPTWTFAPPAGSPSVDAVVVRTTASASPSAVLSPATVKAPSDPTSPASAPDRAAVAIADFAFTPSTIRVGAGGTVTWTNRDSDRHSIVIGGAESDRLTTGGTYRRTFATPGTFAYVCGIHGSMRGTVVVMAAGAVPPAAAAEAPRAVDEATTDGDSGGERTDDDRDDHSGHGHDGDDGDDHHGDDGDDGGHGHGGDDHGGPGRH